MAAIFQRPHPLCTQPARPIHRDGEPALADVDGLVADQLPVLAATAAIVCEPLCMSAPSTMAFVPFTQPKADTPADMACLTSAHARLHACWLDWA
jgi:hypothetical protein